MQVNRRTGIDSRRIAFDTSNWTKDDASPPSIEELSQTYRKVGVDLAAAACFDAIGEACIQAMDITHVVAVTCTDQGNPGYDLHVCQKLGVRPNVQRTLLHGVGCAGGLSALRTGATLAGAESQKGRPARVLIMACEICTLFWRAELLAASLDDDVHIAPALFSDGAAAVVLCNNLALEKQQTPIFELLECGSMSVPETRDHMSYMIRNNGLIATLTKDVPRTAVSSITPMLDSLRDAARTPRQCDPWVDLEPTKFDWAIHPGGAAILKGAQQALRLSDDHIRASLDVYRNNGNASSATVLIVLDKLRHMGKGRDHIVSTSFGPGMIIEMCILRRCHSKENLPRTALDLGWKVHPWLWMQSRMMRLMRDIKGTRQIAEKKHNTSFVL
ncbi:thiolase-like protein [Paraphoma chrysanthemicola]|uniref:Thiolase-like protein n=1 Tax=Paraphoma chrysanthemicola TaxID=798071 RepID=A0A8K0QS34_9PLEO|nr:thiolase-like protein [Paraphoma chrysanthemicola]